MGKNDRTPPPIIIPTRPSDEADSRPSTSSTYDPFSSTPSADVSALRSAAGGPRRVQWPREQDLAEHVSIKMMDQPPMASTSTAVAAADPDASWDSDYTYPPPQPPPPRKSFKLLAKAAVAKAREEERTPNIDDEPSQPRRDDLETFDVFVDKNETDGLPSRTALLHGEGENDSAARGLIRAFTRKNDFTVRQRKNAGFRGGHGEGEKDDGLRVDGPPSEQQPMRRGGSFLQTVRDAMAAAAARDSAEDADVPSRPRQEVESNTDVSGGGILSALIALQRQQADSADGTPSGSGNTSAVTTPTTSAFPSRRSSLAPDEDEDDEYEKQKWLSKQKAKPRNLVLDGAGRSIAGAASRLGVGHSHTRTPSSPLVAKDTAEEVLTTPGTPDPSQKKHRHKSGLSETFQHVKKDVLKFGQAVEDSSRPSASRSGAGVFGGLILGAGNIAGAAAPAATNIGPIVDKHGFHVSRYESTPMSPEKTKKHSPDVPFFSHGRDASGSSAPPSNASSGNNSPEFPRSGTTTPDGLGSKKPTFSLNLKDLTPLGHRHTRSSPRDSPKKEYLDYFGHHREETQEERENREWEKEKRRRRKAKEKKKRDEVFITLHVAAILERQHFLMKLARTFMMFGAPSHRLEAQMQATARVLELSVQVVYIPGVMLLSFADNATHTSDIKFLKQANGLDLGKLRQAYIVYYNVIHDVIGVTEASAQLDALMTAKAKYKLWQQMIIGGLASAFIQPSAFYGSFIDMLMAIPLGAFLVLVQVVVSKNDLYSSLFEIVIAAVFSFIAAALGSTGSFCFAAVASGSIVLILPGYIVLCGSLELANRSIISGSVRLVYSILYSLFLGFGLSIGSEVYQRVTSLSVSTDYQCLSLRVDAPWYRATIDQHWFILTIPCYLLMLSLRNGQPLWRKETIIMIMIGSVGYLANFYAGRAFVNRSDISSALGSLAVGVAGNLYGKFTRGSPFVVMVAGVLLQLPSGLSNGGLLQFTATDNSTTSTTSTTYAAGFQTAESLVEVAIGLTVGLFVSTAVVNACFGGGRRRGNNLSSF